MNVTIPPVRVEAEADTTLPPPMKRPAEELQIGYRVQLRGQLWRVKAVRKNHVSPKITFDLWLRAGGRPDVVQFFPREWLFMAKERRR